MTGSTEKGYPRPAKQRGSHWVSEEWAGLGSIANWAGLLLGPAPVHSQEGDKLTTQEQTTSVCHC